MYAPIGFLLVAIGREPLALLGGAIVLGGAMAPDLDYRIPFVSHRGITHTIWFALLAGLLLGAVGWSFGSSLGVGSRTELSLFGLVVGSVTILAHVLADALTPMGVRPLAPLWSRSISFDIVRAGNPIGNALLLIAGLLAAVAALVFGPDLSVGLS
jgi:Predicted membrane-bound metal-dependent hydrolase (DUF457).